MLDWLRSIRIGTGLDGDPLPTIWCFFGIHTFCFYAWGHEDEHGFCGCGCYCHIDWNCKPHGRIRE